MTALLRTNGFRQPQMPLRISKAKVLRAGGRFAIRFAYLWLLLSLFALHRSLVAGDDFLYSQGLAVFNAFVLAKIMFVAEELHVAENFGNRPLLYPILFRSAVFSMILVGFYILEEVVKGLWQGESIGQSVTLAGGHILGILSVAFIIFVALLPYFAFSELARVIGKNKLRALLLSSRRARTQRIRREKR